MITTTPTILLSFDVEEFDLPLEYACEIDVQTQMNIGFEGLRTIMPLLTNSALPTTLFTTANFANHYPVAIKSLSEIHEIGSHTYYHSSFKNEDLLGSRETLENITGKAVHGLRMPRMQAVDMQDVLNAGYAYDSSINPTLVPGRYNNLSLPRHPYKEKNVLRIPLSVTPNLRLPLFWLSFKNLPYAGYKKMMLKTLRQDGYLCIYFHPWEFTELINDYNIPYYTKKHCGQNLFDRLQTLINDLQKEACFSTMASFCKAYYPA